MMETESGIYSSGMSPTLRMKNSSSSDSITLSRDGSSDKNIVSPLSSQLPAHKLRKQVLSTFKAIRKLRRKYGAAAAYVQELQDEETAFNALTTRYRKSCEVFVESIEEMCHDFCEDLYEELDSRYRMEDYFRSFFSDDCDLIIQGCPYRYHGVNNVITALMVMFQDLSLSHQIDELIVDSSPSSYYDVHLISKCRIKIDKDEYRMVTQMFHLHKSYEEQYNTEQLFCSKFYFVVTDPRPLYYNCEPVPFHEDIENDYDDSDEEETRPTTSKETHALRRESRKSFRKSSRALSQISPRGRNSFKITPKNQTLEQSPKSSRFSFKK